MLSAERLMTYLRTGFKKDIPIRSNMFSVGDTIDGFFRFDGKAHAVTFMISEVKLNHSLILWSQDRFFFSKLKAEKQTQTVITFLLLREEALIKFLAPISNISLSVFESYITIQLPKIGIHVQNRKYTREDLPMRARIFDHDGLEIARQNEIKFGNISAGGMRITLLNQALQANNEYLFSLELFFTDHNIGNSPNLIIKGTWKVLRSSSYNTLSEEQEFAGDFTKLLVKREVISQFILRYKQFLQHIKSEA